MKKILVLTDFSKNALIAAETAAMLAGKLNADLLLCHVDRAIPVRPFYPGIFHDGVENSWKQRCETEMDKTKDHLNRLLSLIKTDQRKPTIFGLVTEGNLATHVVELTERENVEMITIGAPRGSKIDHILLGSDTSSVIEVASCPVLVVPANGSVTVLDRVIFATNYSKADIFAIEYLIELGKLFEYQLEIVHVDLSGTREDVKNVEVMDFVKRLSENMYPNVLFSEITGKDLIHRLGRFYKEWEADLLALTHQPHALFNRIFKDGTVMKSVAIQEFPMLIFPPKLHMD